MLHLLRLRRIALLPVVVVLTVMAMVAGWAFWSTGSGPGGNGAAAATTLNQGNPPTGSASGSAVTLTWTAATLATGTPATGYLIRRYAAGTQVEQTVGTGCTGTVTTTTCTETGVPDGSWLYSVTPTMGTNWRGSESLKSSPVRVDTVNPTSSITVTDVTGGAHLSGTTIWYRGAVNGSFRLTDTVTDAGSGPASSQTAALGGTSTGWSHTPTTVSTPAGGPYASNPFTWTAGATSSPTETVTSRDRSGNAVTTTLTMSDDSTAPSAGSISYPTSSSGGSVSVTFTSGTDTGSGIASRVLQRAHADREDGACGTFGAFRSIGGADPSSPYADAALGNATCYMYRYVVTDRVGNQRIETSAVVVTADYSAAVAAHPSLLGHWRLGETLHASDSFTDSAVKLTKHEGELGTWNAYDGSTIATITPAGRVRRQGSGSAVVLSSARPSSADYAVEADLYYAGALAQDAPGLVGRLDTTTGDFYLATYEMFDQSWNLYRYDDSDNSLYLQAYVTGQALTVGQSYRVRLEMRGSSLRLFVNDSQVLSAVNTILTGAGRAGIWEYYTGSNPPSKTDTSGLHYDNFAVRPLRAVDSKGTNTGRYDDGVVLEQSGALAGDRNTAARFDGSNDGVFVTNPLLNDFSVEFWFRSTQGLGTGGNWWQGAALVDADAGGAANDWGISLRTDGSVMAGLGRVDVNGVSHPDVTIVSAAGGYNDDAWHHVAFTRVAADGTMTLYVDGAQVASGTGPVEARNSGGDLGFGSSPANTNNFAGALDEIALYTGVLSPAAITEHYQLGGTDATNSTGPAGGSVEATGLGGTAGRYSTSTTLNLALAKGSDADGLAASGARLMRASATLTSTAASYDNGACGTFGAYTLVAADPGASPTDTVSSGSCYRYRYVVPDTLENSTTYTSRIIKVDTTAPPNPTLTHYGSLNRSTYARNATATIYYDSGNTGGGFFASVAQSDDPQSGVVDYNFPSLGNGWSLYPSGDQVMYYAWSGTPAEPGTKQVTATNHAASTSGGTGFTVVADNAGPSGGALTVPDTTLTTTTSVSISLGSVSDSGSGVLSRELQRSSGTFDGTTCRAYGSFATVTNGTNPSSPFTDDAPNHQCHTYRYVLRDNVGNETIVTSASVVKVRRIDLKVNFQPDTAPVPTGYVKDIGAAFTTARGFGWVREDSLVNATHTPLDMTAFARDRNRTGIEQRLDTLMHMQPGAFSAGAASGAWEYAVPNSRYTVTVAVGDQAPYDSTHVVRVEGVTAVNAYVATSTAEYATRTVTVDVTDGLLTIDSVGGTNTKLNYAEIVAVDVPAQVQGVSATGGSTGVTVGWTAGTASNLAGYHVYRSSSSNGTYSRVNAAAVTGTSYVDASAPAGVSYYRVTAVDVNGGESVVSATVSAQAPVRINTGGPAVTTGGVSWLADAYSTGGTTYANAQPIAATTDDVLYQSERTGNVPFSYAVPVRNGTYQVRLHFAEIYYGATGGAAGGAGSRVFSADIEGGTVELANFDIFATVGSLTAVQRTYTATITDGTVTIDFTASVNQPKISAIEVIPTG